MEFDVILEMDWLFMHHAKIRCRKREVIFEPPTNDRICYPGEPIKVFPLVIMACQDKRSILGGAITYLMFVVERANESKRV